MILAEYPYVVVRFACTHCPHLGQMRLTRLAEKYGVDISMQTLMNNVAWSCPHPRPGSWHRRPGKYQMRCGIFLPDFDNGKLPPDMPPVRLRLVKPDAAE